MPHRVPAASLVVLAVLVGCAPVQPVIQYVPVPQPAPQVSAPQASAAQPAPVTPQMTQDVDDGPAVWHFYNAKAGRCEAISRLNLMRVLSLNRANSCVDLIPNVQRQFVIRCPETTTSPVTIQVYGVSQVECEQAEAAAETTGVSTGLPVRRAQPQSPTAYTY